jgi:phospholipid transport system substrate-binding protein
MLKKLFYFVLCLTAISGLVIAADNSNVRDVEKLLKEKIDAVLGILQNKEIDEGAKKEQIMDILEPSIDFQLMAKLTLGKDNWSKLNKEQQEEFVSLFVKRLKVSYLDKTSFYNDEKVVYKPGFQKGNKVHVPVDIITGNKPIELLYKFYEDNRDWKAYDIEINGISLIKSYKSQFNEILSSGNADTLINELKKQIQVEQQEQGQDEKKDNARQPANE